MRGKETEPSDLATAGRYALIENRIQDAIEALEKAIELNPEDAQSYNALGIAYSRLGSPERSVHYFSGAVHLAPTNERYWYNLGTAHQSGGYLVRAVRHFQVAARLAPDYRAPHEGISDLRERHPDLDLPGLAVPLTGKTLESALRDLETELRDLPDPTFREQGPEGAPDRRKPLFDISVIDQPTSRFPCFLTRLAGTLLDLTVVQGLWVGVIILLGLLRRSIPGFPVLENGVPLVLGALCGGAYIALTTCRGGQTLGKRILHTYVVDGEGRALQFKQSVLRTLASLLSLASVGLGFLWIAFDRRRQSLHDKLCGTYVIGRRVDRGYGFVMIAGLAAVNAGFIYFLKLQIF